MNGVVSGLDRPDRLSRKLPLGLFSISNLYLYLYLFFIIIIFFFFSFLLFLSLFFFPPLTKRPPPSSSGTHPLTAIVFTQRSEGHRGNTWKQLTLNNFLE